MVCSGFNADFGGDQIAIHVPLSLNTRIKAITLLMTDNNVIHLVHGDPCILPTQDMNPWLILHVVDISRTHRYMSFFIQRNT